MMTELKEEYGDNVTHDHDMSECIMEKDVEIKNEPLEDDGMVLWVKKENEELSNNKTDDQMIQETTYKNNYILQKSRNTDIDGVVKEEIKNAADDSEMEYCYIKEIRKALDSVTGLGTFACGGVLENAKLQLSVKGMGHINLPLSEEEGKVLKVKCTAAPFGRGSETLVHKTVREAWQVDAKDVTLDMEFSDLIKEKLAEIIPKLTGESFSDSTMCNSVEPELYKLVYYEAGGHFLPHRDTEKGPGMFATLVVQLPAGHKDGALVLRHKGDTKVFKYDNDSKSKYFFTAFYADCEHELQRVRSGHRLVLIYNLIRKNPYSTLHPINNTMPSKNDIFLASMKKSVEQWKSDNKGPEYLTLKLDHLYTKANISFQNMKGKDKNIVDALCSCADIEVYLATLTKLEHRMGYDDEPRGSDCEPDLYPIDDVDVELKESSYTLTNWLGAHDNIKHFGEFNLSKNEMLIEEEMFPKDERSITKKDRWLFDKDFQEDIKSEYIFKAEYTGNAGCNVEYFYKKTAIVFFPKSHEILISCENNLHTNLVTCKKLANINVDAALDILQGIFFFIGKRHNRAMIQLVERDNVATILEIMILFEKDIVMIKSLAKKIILALVIPYKPEECYSEEKNVGLPTLNSAFALANLINKLGWESLGTSVLQFISECAVTNTLSCAQLVSCMHSFGLQGQASSVVEIVVSQIITKSEDFDSDRWALWAVLVASHDTFSTYFDTIFHQILKMKDKAMIEVISQMFKSLQPNVINQCKIRTCFQTVLSILKDNGWKNLSVGSVLLIWPVVLFVDKLNDSSPMHSLAQTIIEHENSSQYLKELLKLGDNVEEKDNPSVQLLVKKRLEQLENITKPVFSWAQPEATLVSRSSYFSRYTDSSDSEEDYFSYLHRKREAYFEPSTILIKDVENFLRGNEETKSFGGFKKKKQVKQFGEEYFPNGSYTELGKYSARYKVSREYDSDEDDETLFCTISKTKNLFEEQDSLYTSMHTEAKNLKETYCEPKKIVARKRQRV